MRKILLSTVATAGLLGFAGAVSAADLLTAEQMDGVTAGADIVTSQIAQATTSFDITTNADHSVNVTSQDIADVAVVTVVDASAVGSGLAQATLDTSTTND